MGPLLARAARHDHALFSFVQRLRRPRLDHAVATLTHLGGATASLGAATLLAFGAAARLTHAGRVALVGLVVSHIFVQLVKRSVCRPRPIPPSGVRRTLRAPDPFSFPSGHAAASLSVALPVAHTLGGALGMLVLSSGVLVGLSRCYLALHYPGDVIAGWCLAVLGLASAPWLIAVFA